MKKFSVWICILVACMLFSSVTCAAEPVGEEDLTVLSGCSTLLARQPLAGSEKKVETAKSVILYELNTDTMLYAYNPDLSVNPTGLVKLLTALIAIENGNLDEEVTAYSSTLNTVAIGSVSVGLKGGEVMTLRDLLYCVMVASANDAAAVIAAHIGGNQAGFVEMMNQKAAQLGCQDSYFTNAHGLSDPQQRSTARDLAIITKAALDNEIFVEMFAAKTYTVPATNKSEPRKLNTTNHMMHDAVIPTALDRRVTGGKPAAATNTDRSMICTAEVDSSRYLCVVMGAAAEVSEDGLSITRWNIFEEVSFLLDFGFANFAVRQILSDQQSMYQYTVSGAGCDVVLRPSKSVSVVLPIGFDPQQLSYHNMVDANALAAPLKQGQKVGALQVSFGSIYVAICDLVAMHDVNLLDFGIEDGERLEFEEPIVEKFDWRPILIWGGTILGCLVFLCIGILLLIRYIRNARLRAQHRRRARDRRRTRR